MGPRNKQAGVALLMVLLIVFIATFAAARLVYDFQLSLNRSAVLMGQRQAWYYALGGEAWAMEILRRDAEESETDHLGEDWAKPITGLAIQGGVISTKIEDAQSRFNLNGLVNEEGEAIPEQVEQLERLLIGLGLDVNLAPAIVDWIDADSEPRFPDGAEGTEYQAQDPPYLTADAPMGSASELRLVRGVTAEVYETLEPHVIVLPRKGLVPVNVNSATAAVLRSLHADIDKATADGLREAVGTKGFNSVEEFTGNPALQNLQIPSDNLSVRSEFFVISTEVDTEYGRLRLRSTVERAPDGPLKLSSRSLGGLQ